MGFNDINLQVSGPQQPASIYKTKVLKGQVPFATQVTEPNTKYVIKHNFGLGGESITIPEGCLLEFDGGSFSNGTLVGNNTILMYKQPIEEVLDVTLSGTFIYDDGQIDKIDNANGMGKIYLKKDKSFASQITQPNTTYVIQHDFTLTDDVTIPENCVLEFDGGSISGEHTLTGANTGISAGMVKIFDTDVVLSGSWKILEIYPEWFGAVGNFNPTTKTGTDDSAAITKAITTAESIGTGKVKFSSVNYLVTSGIHITTGNIWLEGTYAMLREEAYDSNNDVIVNLPASTLWASDNTRLITVDETVKNPIRISNLQMSGVNIGANTIGIHFKATFSGPTWPFIVEHCHLRFFSTAISFNSTTRYCVNGVRINNNAFWHNQWCVVFEELTEDANYFHTNITWSLDFNYNFAHQNTHILNVHCSYGCCNIIGNNMEGNSEPSVSDTVEYLNIVGLSQGAHLNFKDNHFESITLKILKIEYFLNDVYVNIDENNAIGANASLRRVDFSRRTKGAAYCPVTIDKCDLTPYVIDGGNFICNSPIVFKLVGNSSIAVLSDFPYTKGNTSMEEIYTLANTGDFKMCGGILEAKKLTNSSRAIVIQGEKSESNKYVHVLAAFSPEGFLNTQFYLINCRDWGSPIFVSRNNKKYLYYIVQKDTFGDASNHIDYIILNTNQQYITSVRAAILAVSKGTEINTELFPDVTNRLNHISALTNNTTIAGLIMGDYVFDRTDKKYKVWKGNEWTDAAGNTL